MVAQKVNIPGIQDPNIETDMVLRPIKIYHEDGVSETAYVQASPTGDKNKALTLHNKLTIIYMSVAIIALTISAFVGIHKMKNS